MIENSLDENPLNIYRNLMLAKSFLSHWQYIVRMRNTIRILPTT